MEYLLYLNSKVEIKVIKNKNKIHIKGNKKHIEKLIEFNNEIYHKGTRGKMRI